MIHASAPPHFNASPLWVLSAASPPPHPARIPPDRPMQPGGPAQPRSAPCEPRPRPAFPRRLNVADPLQRGLTRSGDISAFLPDYKDPPPPFRSASASSPLRHSEPPHRPPSTTPPCGFCLLCQPGAHRGDPGEGWGGVWGGVSRGEWCEFIGHGRPHYLSHPPPPASGGEGVALSPGDDAM